MAGFKRFEEIVAWKEGRSLVKTIYAMTRSGELSRDFGLRDQIQRAAVSICSNIAEGYERRGNKEFVRFLWIAKGSAAEVASQLYHLLDLGYITNSDFDIAYTSAKQIGSLIYKLIASIPDRDFIRTPSRTSSTSSTSRTSSTSSTSRTSSTSSTSSSIK